MVREVLLNTACFLNANNGLAGAARKCLPEDMVVSMWVISSFMERVVSLIIRMVSCIVSSSAALLVSTR